MATLLHITTRAVGAKPVESGKRATAKGFTKYDEVHYKYTDNQRHGVWKFTNNYTGLFFEDGTHMTWAYGKGLCFPEGVKEGDKGTVDILGGYSDNEVACLVVSYKGQIHQP